MLPGKRPVATAVLTLALSLVAACDGASADSTAGAGGPGAGGAGGGAGGPGGGESALAVVPGKSVGPIALDMTFAEVRAALGEPTATLANNRVGFVQYDALGLELAVTTPSPSAVEDGALVLAIGLSSAVGFSGGPLVGQTRGQIEEALGAPADEVGPISYYAAGASVEWDDSEKAARVAVTPVYAPAPTPPEMTPAR